MKAMKVLGSLLAVLVAGFLVVTLTIDGIVKSQIEESGSKLLNTKVEVDDVDISLLNGTGSMDGFIVFNPEGFSTEAAMDLEEIEMDVDLKSLFSDTVIVKRLQIKNPAISLEQKGSDINLRTISENLEVDEENENQKSLVIDRFILEEGEITVSSNIDEKRTTKAKVSRIELNDIGKNGSNTIQEGMKEVLEPVISEALSSALKSTLFDKLEDTFNEVIK
ncbi:hypothetical protein [Balneola vulgaris]|jgi:uncharacterized protein involved in outer membrane biogenesis|uniref:DUF748 domain-containing protein n=1 Tax=Balneola vulgaris TaxID=287535 RepID=UPI00036E7781|nr:hypothetical protein [Balneola vulgaris]